jgi:hypothetical protein
MKYFLPLALFVFSLASCKTSKNYLTRLDDDKSIFDAVKALEKNAGDTNALNVLPLIYKNAETRHLQKISSYGGSPDISRWDKILSEYNILQDMYMAISSNSTANNIVKAKNYQPIIYELQQQAAEDYYAEATFRFGKAGRDNVKQAYAYFKKADKLSPGFKDAQARMEEAYQASIVNVVINPVADNSFFFNTGGWGNYGYNYSNEYFQQTLVRELGGENSTRYPARFYTDWQARRDNVQPDWVVDLTLRNMDIPQPSIYNYRRNASKRIETGRDTGNKPIYQTVYATINISRHSFNARADMEVRITELVTRKNISNNNYSEYYNWQEETATYSGDSRALSSSDWDMINNNRFYEPRREDILNELYRKLYTQVRNRIVYAVDW